VGLYEYLNILRLRWRVFAFVVLVIVGTVTAGSLLTTPLYTTKATLYFAAEPRQSDTGNTTTLLYPQTIVSSYAAAATGQYVLQPVIDTLHLNTTVSRLAERVSAESPLGTVIIEIRATDPSPQRAVDIANAVATQLSSSSNRLAPDAGTGQTPILVSQIQSARIPTGPSSPRKQLNVTLAVIWALLIGFVLCVWLDRLDPRVRSRLDLTTLTTAPLLGFLPRRPRGRKSTHGNSGRAQWGQVQTNFSFLRDGYGLKSILFVAATAEEPAGRVVDHLGSWLLQSGSRVLLVDADLRPLEEAGRPSLLGLSSVLRGDCRLQDAVVERVELPALLHPGPSVVDPGAAFGSLAMAAILREAEEQYDIVLVRAAPLTVATEGLDLSATVDGVFVVGDSQAMRRNLMEQTLRALDRAGGRVRGVVLSA
jgi:succinoglycan biosynthesis transport protein ExoP